MNRLSTARILDAAVAQQIPASLNLAPAVLARIQSKKKPLARPGLKLAGTLLLVLLAVLAATSIVYAIYRWVTSDPGLQSVLDAGLETNLNVTSLPTLLPTATPVLEPPSAAVLNLSQTIDGATMRLDYVYLDEGRLALGMSYADLPFNTVPGTPQVTFKDVEPTQALGFSQIVRQDELKALYVSYQVIHADAVGGKVSLSVEVPLVRQTDGGIAGEQNFRFEAADVPVSRGQTLAIQQTAAARRNGVEVRLKSVRVLPFTSEVTACYDFPNPEAPFYYVQSATLQSAGGSEEGYLSYQYLDEIEDDHCVRLGYGLGSADVQNPLIFRVQRLVVPLTMQDVVPQARIDAANQELAQYSIEIRSAPAAQSEGPGGWQFVRKPAAGTDPTQDASLLVLHALEEKMDGPWEFYIDLPREELIPGLPEPTPTATAAPLGSQEVEGVSMSLDWVFVDARRAAAGYTIRRLPDTPDATSLLGRFELKDAQGAPVGGAGIGSSSIERVKDQPGVLQGTYSVGFTTPLTQKEASFSLDVTLDGSNPADTLAYFPIPPEATPYPPGVFPPRLPDRLIGTFHFEFTAPVHPLQTILDLPPVSAAGVEMRIPRVDITASFTEAMLCYNKPAKGDWWVMSAGLQNAGGESASIQGGRMLYDSEYELPPRKQTGQEWSIPEEIKSAANGRCVSLEFLIGHGGKPGLVTLTVPRLELSVPEVIPDDQIRAVQEKLRAEGIEMEYITGSSAGGGGGGGPIFSSLPEGMDQQQAYQRLMAALGYVHAGPWEFTFEVQPGE